MAKKKDKHDEGMAQSMKIEIDYKKLEEAIGNAIISVEEKSREAERNAFANKKLSKFVKVLLWVLGVVVAANIVLMLSFLIPPIDFGQAAKSFYTAVILALMGLLIFVADKAPNTTTRNNYMSMVLGVISLVIAFGSFMGI